MPSNWYQLPSLNVFKMRKVSTTFLLYPSQKRNIKTKEKEVISTKKYYPNYLLKGARFLQEYGGNVRKALEHVYPNIGLESSKYSIMPGMSRTKQQRKGEKEKGKERARKKA